MFSAYDGLRYDVIVIISSFSNEHIGLKRAQSGSVVMGGIAGGRHVP
jgi:hypothetical protein